MNSRLSGISRLPGRFPEGPNRRGNALVVTLLITMALTGLVFGALMATQTETRISSNQSMQQKAFYLAERGVEESIAYLSQLGQPLGGSGPSGSGPVALFSEVTAGEGRYTAWADPLDSSLGSSTRFVAITVRSTLDGAGVSKAIQVKLGQQNFSRFAYFTNIETSPGGGSIWFTGNDEFFGPVHTNDDLHISDNPIFHDEVTSSGDEIIYYHGGPPTDDPVFDEGYDLDVPEIPLPSNTDLLKSKAQEPDGLYLTGNPVSVTMLYDAGTDEGKMLVSINGGGPALYDIPTNGVFFVDGKIELEGELKGQMTIGCDGDIEIMDDVVYHTDPRSDPTSTDLLGIVAEGDVFMDGDQYGENVDVGDETIMAVIMALDESWTVENYNSGSPRGNLVVYGGLIQERRGPVGTFNPWTSEIVTGYAKDYSYDPRLMDNPPPFFPTTGEIDKIAWREVDPSSDITENVW